MKQEAADVSRTRHRLNPRPSGQGARQWGHDGDRLGFSVQAGATTNGRQAIVMVNLNPGGGPALDDAMDVVLPTALCGK
ncbi:hypothetical protein [Actinomadura macrotermitis]|uniref:Uncharacterized protein n=1 Tax=Actinomadura macrotermitis TaxID=2585200 RepID=A0A7K0BZJ5_9ACTN|nr:hypothetical protein [Actinomadura macrotermitis]MQY06074.1 hypothetical protein [Actinomadura macrotermitis]